ncbi:MAG: winged helix-turn-helix domain-containing protein [Bryobacteraceae bacterium]
MAGKSTLRVFRFGPFEADEAAGELRKHGVRVKLHSQPFQLLLMLLERHSQLVTRDELRQRLWREDTFVDFDHGLNTAVNKLRQALGDSASQPRHVETIPGKGYRFISPVIFPEPVLELPEQPVTALLSQAAPQLKQEDSLPISTNSLLTTLHELPRAPRPLLRGLLLLVQAMYLAFYLGALANLKEIYEILSDARPLSPEMLMIVLVTTAAVMIPVRLFVAAAVAFDYQQLSIKFSRFFPVLLLVDIFWALSPFLLIHHISTGLALGMTAALLYVPFAQRSLVLMYAHRT